MRKILLFLFISFLSAQNNSTKSDNNTSKDKNFTKNKLEQNIQKQIEKEKLYKKQQKFYMGDDYNLSDKKVDSSSLKNIKVIKPDYDYELLEF